jgi:Polyketide cyclase / dehydrase and lipid transport
MITLQAGFRLDAPAHAVWALINWSGVEALCNTGIFARAVRFTAKEARPGARRVFTTADASPDIVELLLHYDDDLRVYTYRLADAGALPIGDYEGRISVTPAGPEACLLCFSARCVPVGITEQALRDFYERAETQIAHAVARQLGAKLSP